MHIYIYIYKRGSLYKFLDFFFVWALLLIVHTLNSSPLRSNLLWLQFTCTVPTTSGKNQESLLVQVCQWPSSQPLSSPEMSHNDSKSHREQGLDYIAGENCLDAHVGQIVCVKDEVVDWGNVLLEMPLTRFEECPPLPTESLSELP